MKKIVISFLLILILSGCSSLPFDSSLDSVWEGDIKNPKGSVRILSVSAERSGEWGSLEKEARDLLPLLFSENKYLVVSVLQSADYKAEVQLREREYSDGWRTKHSLSAEVRLWNEGSSGLLPLSAGRVLIEGKKSLASSGTLYNMLRKAVRNAVRGLPEAK